MSCMTFENNNWIILWRINTRTREMAYLFTSKRLGFRNWEITDIPKMAAISGDPEVMRFFPSTQSEEETSKFIDRMKNMYDERGHCFYAVESLESRSLIGFIGISYATFKSDFTPAPELGWRLGRSFWGHGYATEGAKRCIEYGMKDLGIENFIAVAPKINVPSINVMKKIGMKKFCDFIHPSVEAYPDFRNCVCYVYGLEVG